MRIEQEERRCDQCGKAVTAQKGVFGPAAFEGWLSASRTVGFAYGRRAEEQPGPWDFCSTDCIATFFADGGQGRNRKGLTT